MSPKNALILLICGDLVIYGSDSSFYMIIFDLMRGVYFLTILLLVAACKQELSPNPPEAEFSADNNGCIEPCTLTFYNNSKYFTAIAWDFGNGQSSGDSIVRVGYDSAGLYTVQLEATNSLGETDLEQKSIEIAAGKRMLISSIQLRQIPMLNENGDPWDSADDPDVFVSINVEDTIYSSSYAIWNELNNSILPLDIQQTIALEDYFKEHVFYVLEKDNSSVSVIHDFHFYQYDYLDYPSTIELKSDSTIVNLEVSWQ